MIGAVGTAAPLPGADRARAARRDRAHRRLREAPGHRDHDDLRAADVRDRGRRHAADPAHRRAAAARVVRRVEPRGDLRDARAPAARLGRARGSDRVDRQIRKLGIALTLLFGVLFAQMAYVQVIAADRIRNDPANASRQIIAEYKVERGAILSQDGRVLAESVKANGQDRLPLRAHLSRGAAVRGDHRLLLARVRARALESSMNEYLSGEAPELAVSNFSDLVLGKPKKGGTVKTSIRTYLQEAAARALGDLPGAVVAVDPRQRRRHGDGREPELRPQPALAGHGRRDEGGVDRLQRRSREADALARQGRAVPAGVDVQDHHDVGGVPARVQARDHGAQPARPRPAAHERHARELRRIALQRRLGHGDGGRGVRGVVQRAVRRDRPGPGRRRRCRTRRGRSGSARPTRPTQTDVHRPDALVRGAVPGRALPDPGVLRATTTRCSRSRRSAWTTWSRTPCTWRWSGPRSRTAARCASRGSCARSATRRAA